MSTPPLTFPRRAHLRTSAEFQTVFAEGKRVSGQYFRLHAHIAIGADADAVRRLGIAVSKRVDKSAVVRNRLRRQVKEVFRLHSVLLPVGDYVLVAKPEAGKVENRQLRHDLLAVIERARTLKPMPAPGTMPANVAGTDRKPTEP